MRDQETGSTERLVNRTPGAYCDFALFEADGTCRVIAAHSKRAKLQPGMEFFPGVGASGSEVQFALHALLDLREHYVLIRSDAGPVLLSDYFYLSVRLICAVIPHVRTESAARVSHNCFSEIVLSPALSALKMEPVAGDENTYVLLQHIRSCLRDGFPRATANETCPAQEAIRSVYRSAQMLTELVGSRFHMTYPETDHKYRIQYDPVIGTLCLLVYFCYVDRVVGNSNILLSVLPSDGIILKKTSVSFNDGETVFDILCRETRNRQIHMESSYTPVFNSAYIEGINNLYEFDCGEGSGWVYSVNGVYPNYGCSNYKVQPGDSIEWHYTCNYGKDVGAEVTG